MLRRSRGPEMLEAGRVADEDPDGKFGKFSKRPVRAVCFMILLLPLACLGVFILYPGEVPGRRDFFRVGLKEHYVRFRKTLKKIRQALTPHPCRTLNTGCHTVCLQKLYNDAIADRALRMLQVGSMPDAKPENPFLQGALFEAVQISMPLAPPYIDHVPEFNESNKNIIPMSSLAGQEGGGCVVYGAGIDGDSSFENKMASLGHRTFGFDCTLAMDAPSLFERKFTFYPWCIGNLQNASFTEENAYFQGDTGGLKFLSLADVMKALNHSHIDLLKFDIEGFEWELIEQQLLGSSVRPWQLSFELHTELTSSLFVPPKVVQGKDYVAVNRLFLKLHNLGYRVVSKELNGVCCAEFVLVYANTLNDTPQAHV